MSKADAEDALMVIQQISAEAQAMIDRLEFPAKAIEYLFGVTEKDMVLAINASRQLGINPTTIVLPPMGSNKKFIHTFRGLRLVVGDHLEAK